MSIIEQASLSSRLADKLGKPAKIVINGQVWLLRSNPCNTWYENQHTSEQITVRGTSTLEIRFWWDRDLARPICQQIAAALGWPKMRMIGGVK